MSPTRLVLAGVLFAFLVCAANLTLLVRRTAVVAPAGRSGGSDSPVVTASLNEIDARKDAISSSSSPVANVDDHSCLQARRDTIPRRLYGNLSLPYINLGEQLLEPCFNCCVLPPSPPDELAVNARAIAVGISELPGGIIMISPSLTRGGVGNNNCPFKNRVVFFCSVHLQAEGGGALLRSGGISRRLPRSKHRVLLPKMLFHYS